MGYNTSFNVLGIIFNVDLNEMIQINYEKQLDKIYKILNVWSKRQLSPIGRITVIKTLVLSTLNHILIALPNPPKSTIKHLNTSFFLNVCGNLTGIEYDVPFLQKNTKMGIKND